jgi:hypothetical protein
MRVIGAMTRCGRNWMLSERSAYRHATCPHLLRGPVDCPETEKLYSEGIARTVCVLVQEHSALGSAT